MIEYINDENAPYNQVDYYERYDKYIIDMLDDEMKTQSSVFEDWLNENEYLPLSYSSKSIKSELIKTLSTDSRLKDEYYDYRKEELLEVVKSQMEYEYEQ